MGLIKNQYVARTFIQPTQELREQGLRLDRCGFQQRRVVLHVAGLVLREERPVGIERVDVIDQQKSFQYIHIAISLSNRPA